MQRFKILKFYLDKETTIVIHEHLCYEEAIAHVAKLNRLALLAELNRIPLVAELNRIPYTTVWYCVVPQFANQFANVQLTTGS